MIIWNIKSQNICSGNFAEEFTDMAPVDSPAVVPQSAKRVNQLFRVSWT